MIIAYTYIMTSTSDDVCQENALKAIQNEYIVDHLFSFLSVNDIKNCRLANRIWRNVGTKFLRKNTRVLFDFEKVSFCLGDVRNPHEEAIFLEKKNQMKEVSDYCKENTPENTPISSFEFGGKFEYSHFINILDDVRSYITELKFSGGIAYEQRERVTVAISRKIPPHLTKLHIELNHITRVTVSLYLDQISFVKDLYLDCCTIVVDTTEKRLSPTDITLGPSNKYIKKGTEVEFLVNESFDLTLTKEINLDGDNLILNFSDCANDKVERTVILKDVIVENWEMCNWKIKMLSLGGIPFLDKNFIEMEELITYDLTIDLSKIYNPASLLKLNFYYDTTIDEVPFFLPNLVDVTLYGENCVAKLPYFTNNKNISTMWLQSDEGVNEAMLSVNINDLPTGINELTLTKIGVHGDGVYQLQTLNMEDYYFVSKCATFAAKFRSEIFQFYQNNISTDEDIKAVLQILNLGDSYRRLIIGHFDWEGINAFSNSAISKYVDREAKFYVFEGKRGKGLTKEEIDSGIFMYL